MSDHMSLYLTAIRRVGDDKEEVATELCSVPANKHVMFNTIVRFQERANELFDDGKLADLAAPCEYPEEEVE